MTLKICIAQLNYCVGDVAGNSQKIVEAARQAYASGARLVLTPELSICGYAAEDLFLRPAFIRACDDALRAITQQLADLPGLALVVGHPTRFGEGVASASASAGEHLPCFNAASVLREGTVIASYAKRELPNYRVFDERRYFTPGQGVCVFEVGDATQPLRVGLLICEDAWYEEPARLAQQAGAQVLAVINASPFHMGKGEAREHIMAERARAVALPLVYAHLVGGQDEVVFDGRSFALHADGTVAARAASFTECVFDINAHIAPAPPAMPQPSTAPVAWQLSGVIAPPRSEEADLWDALVLGVRDYVGKNGFPSVLLGLSGGIDSALVLAIAVDALGAEKVRCVMMPSPYTADISWIDARAMAQGLGVRYDEISIVPEFDAFKTSLANEFAGLEEDATEENIQARIRGTLLMALSNKFGSLVLTTGNKSEMATGYCTLYGDMAGGFAVIKDLVKTQVFHLARWRNANDPYARGQAPIPERIITRPPSAELRPNQTDQDSLPPYPVLDAIVQGYMEHDQSVESLVAQGFALADVQKVSRLIQRNEYKRRQAPIGIRLTQRSFGKDWRYPITNKFRA